MYFVSLHCRNQNKSLIWMSPCSLSVIWSRHSYETEDPLIYHIVSNYSHTMNILTLQSNIDWTHDPAPCGHQCWVTSLGHYQALCIPTHSAGCKKVFLKIIVKLASIIGLQIQSFHAKTAFSHGLGHEESLGKTLKLCSSSTELYHFIDVYL